MMLSLFKDQVTVERKEAVSIARRLLVSSLNRGTIPNWDSYFQELPVLQSAEDLEEVKTNFLKLTEWEFLREVLSESGTEYYLHSPTHSQRLSLSGEKIPVTVPLEEEDWQLWLEILSLKHRQNWNVENPFVSFYGELFGKNYRLSLVHASTSPLGKSKLVLRSLASIPHVLNTFGDVDLLRNLMLKKSNMLVAGSTGSGKTSLLSSLIQEIDTNDHVVILEDTFEINSTHPHQTRFLSGETPQTSLKAYLSYSLRLTPDRIILGEMRSHEVIPFLMAMNTGHKGLLGTIHASSAVDALHRVALLFTLNSGDLAYEKVMELLCRNLEYVVFMENKKVKEVIRVLGSERGSPFFESAV